MKSRPSVFIVGAGAAGLAAARKLSEAGVSVSVFEGRARVGGRIYTQQVSGFPLDLGAEFVHGEAPEIRAVLKKATREIVHLQECHEVIFKGETHSGDQLWPKVEHLIDSFQIRNPDRAVADAVAEHGNEFCNWEREMLLNYLEGFNAADVRLMSESAMAAETAGSGLIANARIRRGYGALLSRLANRSFEILTDAPVSEIKWTKGAVQLQIGRKRETREAQAVILTVPPSQLVNGSIRFLPELKEKIGAAAGLKMGTVYKVAFLFSKPPWQARSDIHFIHTPELTFGTRWLWGIYDSRVLISWAGGRRAERLGLHSPDEVINVAIRDLARAVQRPEQQLRECIQAVGFHDWKQDPWIHGAYSYVCVGHHGAREALAEAVEDTIFFAGEATMADGSAGTVHGAIRSGFRAAEEILASHLGN